MSDLVHGNEMTWFSRRLSDDYCNPFQSRQCLWVLNL